ncbi:unnamed protein product, partial [Pelagomonas calceolata]
MANKLHISPTVLQARQTSSEPAPKKCCLSTSPRSMHSRASKYWPFCWKFVQVSSILCKANNSALSSSPSFWRAAMVSSILLGLPLAVVSLWGGLGGVRGASGRLTRVVGLPRCGVLRGRRVGGVYRPSLPS